MAIISAVTGAPKIYLASESTQSSGTGSPVTGAVTHTHSINQDYTSTTMAIVIGTCTDSTTSEPTITVEGNATTKAFWLGGRHGASGQYAYIWIGYYDASSESTSADLEISSLTDYYYVYSDVYSLGSQGTISMTDSDSDNGAGNAAIGLTGLSAVSINQLAVCSGITIYNAGSGKNTSSSWTDSVTTTYTPARS